MAVRLSSKDKLTIISNLGTLLSAGIPILEAVDSILEDARGSQKKILETLRKDINQGKTISESFQKFPDAFDSVTVNLIKASEEAGNLETSLKDLKETIKKEIDFNDKVKAALTYPAFLLAVFFGVILIILFFVIPRIALVFTRLKIQLPLPTRIMVFVSNILTSYTIYVAVGFALLVILLVFLYRTRRRYLVNIIFSLPLLSHLAKLIDLTRFTRSMHLLLASGIPITDALALSRDIVDKHDISKAIASSLVMVNAGKKLSEGLSKHKGVIPRVMIRITEAGEKSGKLEQSMQELSEYFDSEVSSMLKTLTTLLEPIMLIVIAIFVGALMLSIIAPIYGMIGQIQGGT